MRLRADVTAIALVLVVAVAVPVALRGPWAGECVGVGDGDTITVVHYGRSEVIRLYGVDCPENGQTFGSQAKAYTTSLCLGKVVRVYPRERDQYGRTVATVLLPDGSSLGAVLVRDGCAWWYRHYAPDDEQLRDLEAGARARRAGLWAGANPIPPWDFRRR
ncbi:MAG: hypothetical protein HPY69_15460 [Armatimonadetes bacterium]|nr:hypothetical protein [Armatimonadota bacterium]